MKKVIHYLVGLLCFLITSAHAIESCEGARPNTVAWQACIESALTELSLSNALTVQIATRARSEAINSTASSQAATQKAEDATKVANGAVLKATQAIDIANSANNKADNALTQVAELKKLVGKIRPGQIKVIPFSKVFGPRDTYSQPFEWDDKTMGRPIAAVVQPNTAGGQAELIFSVVDLTPTGGVLYVHNPRSDAWNAGGTALSVIAFYAVN